MFSKDMTLQKIQKVSLENAIYFTEFCKRNNLLCYLCGGGAIGAIRHKGFVPWDDDLDFFMPRKDYEKLFKLWKANENEQRYFLSKTSKEYNDKNSFMTLRDKETTFIKTYQSNLDIVHGIQIDIFPLDNAPESKIQRKFQKMWALVYALFCSQQIPKNHGKLLEIISSVLLNIAKGPKRKYYIWRYAEGRMTKYSQSKTQYVTELCVGPKYMGNIYPKIEFSEAIWMPFEDTKLPIPIGYDKYLSRVFGDYMTMPPVNQRKSHHEAVFIDPDNSYLKYKGIYYLKEEGETK
ncbi:LicD family protein [Enterococcus pallens]|uniref:LicD/FKTN/FKRP nucleotidyltransferase domain-containing protein n=1 Tax=Enterococcus pallens ATCC BAA-351 TaxID=1158607 RepID=R2S4F1_9ENTE|nr:LicD family protein [Enterococcus pallens]EOH87791.1 hypothetical protein UAU_04645 [Enterococcus pallens ATCC BAA-351]EOU18005.1 hypothetical protein I588_02993 [Enterococcus pallens ATCC BAA-351]OJG82371.1 hypothetical protein RV10_GL000192 [Enterococcus pallens]